MQTSDVDVDLNDADDGTTTGVPELTSSISASASEGDATTSGQAPEGSSDESDESGDETTTGAGETSDGVGESDGRGTTGAESSSGSVDSDSTGGSTGLPTDDESSSGGDVPVEPITEVDLSGYVLQQTNAAYTFTLPPGTILERDDLIIVARDATQAEFEAHWGVTLPARVTYFNSQGGFPSINGDETYSVLSDLGSAVDGPSIVLDVGQSAQRLEDETGTPGSWSLAASEMAVPGTSVSLQAETPAPFLAAYSDALGPGNYVYEFVELAVSFPALEPG